MRTLTPALALAAASLTATPDLRLELADCWPHFADVVTDGPVGGYGGPCAAALAADGALLATYLTSADPAFLHGALYVARTDDPADPLQWRWTRIADDASAIAGPAICVGGGITRLLWQAGTSSAVRAADSMDGGQTWGAPYVLFDPGGVVHGIAAAGDPATVLIAYDALGLGSVRLAAWRHTATGWAGADWPNGDQHTIVGLAATRNPDGSYLLAAALQGISGATYSIASLTYGLAGDWSALALVAEVDTSVGLRVRAPHLTQFDGMYRLSYLVEDSGGTPYSRVARTASPDAVHWQAPLEDATTFPNGAVWLRQARGQLLVAAEMVRFAPAYDPALHYHDLTADVVRLDLVEREGEPAHLVVTLDNSSGAYTTLPALRSNARLLLSQGFAGGAGLIPTHLLYVQEWTFVRAADEMSVVLVARDRTRFLDRQSSLPLSYRQQQLGTTTADLAIRAGFDAVSLDAAASQLATVVGAFQVQPGQTYREALRRLLAGYDLVLAARTLLDTSQPLAARDMLAIVGKRADQPLAWHYGDEPEYVHLTHLGVEANHLVVYGASGTRAEAWDFVAANDAGQERYALIAEGLAGDAAAATLVATLAQARETRLTTRLELATGPHPGLELFDVIDVGDSALAAAGGRIVALTLTYYPLEALHELVLACEGR